MIVCVMLGSQNEKFLNPEMFVWPPEQSHRVADQPYRRNCPHTTKGLFKKSHPKYLRIQGSYLIVAVRYQERFFGVCGDCMAAIRTQTRSFARRLKSNVIVAGTRRRSFQRFA